MVTDCLFSLKFLASESTVCFLLVLWHFLIREDPDAGRDWGQEEKGMTEDEMVGWHHQVDAREFV